MEKIKIPNQFWENIRWAEKHMPKLQKNYLEKWVAIVNKEVAGVGEDGNIARRIAREKTGEKFIPVIFIESGEALYQVK